MNAPRIDVEIGAFAAMGMGVLRVVTSRGQVSLFHRDSDERPARELFTLSPRGALAVARFLELGAAHAEGGDVGERKASATLKLLALVDRREGAADAAAAVSSLGEALGVAVRIARQAGVTPKAAGVMLRALFSRYAQVHSRGGIQ